MDYSLDETDKRMIAILRENARESFASMAKQVKLSEGAIRKRMKSLVERGVITRFTVEVGEPQHAVRAMIMVKLVAKAPSDRIVAYIKSLRGVSSVYAITGVYDIYVEAAVDSNRELHGIILSIRGQRGVASTSTMTILG